MRARASGVHRPALHPRRSPRFLPAFPHLPPIRGNAHGPTLCALGRQPMPTGSICARYGSWKTRAVCGKVLLREIGHSSMLLECDAVSEEHKNVGDAGDCRAARVRGLRPGVNERVRANFAPRPPRCKRGVANRMCPRRHDLGAGLCVIKRLCAGPARRQYAGAGRACRARDPHLPARPRCRPRHRLQPLQIQPACVLRRTPWPCIRPSTSTSPARPSANVRRSTPWRTTDTAVMSGVRPIIGGVLSREVSH
jgi:hypothetical protein